VIAPHQSCRKRRSRAIPVRENLQPRVAEGHICNTFQDAGPHPFQAFSGEQFKTRNDKIFLGF
jgi:hypothetical protein